MKIDKLADFSDPSLCHRLVVKIGSALLVDDDGEIRTEWLRTVIEDVREARDRGQEVVIVSSGSIAIGAKKLGFFGKRRSLSEAQASAAVGQITLASTWSDLLAEQGMTAAQMLLTLDDFEGRRRYLNASSTFGRLLKSSVVPVVNENDSIATGEIRFGDNDRLAARVAQSCSADGVILLTDVDGLYDKHPNEPDATRLEKVHGVTEEIQAMADSESGSDVGTGGMTAKLLAAQIAERAGIALAIVDGSHRKPLTYAAENTSGTLFLPKRDDSAYKAWIGGRMRFNGSITVDDGCASALHDGRSLLAAGIVKVDGDFERGDVITIHDLVGRMIAKGMTEYDAEDCDAIKGKQNSKQEAILGHTPRSAVIHRDQLVLL
ncbi:glutamate 5-kinase [Qipengyuania atrilutea]|uniref:Glutamate 5-kinase n=1 Tax=Qipengyuania atrilutea TaxID=2744473 RepID=A0A850H1L7_9SPHN|nr:glutamate 5-kinase [Actirhodobacter atriluteus]NVD45874.1 glutamate 5-kinase [Actirhodobacter atriluteus]